jgi:hypothetical protein
MSISRVRLEYLQCQVHFDPKFQQQAEQICESLRTKPALAVAALRKCAEEGWHSWLSLESKVDSYADQCGFFTSSMLHSAAYLSMALRFARGYVWCPQRSDLSASADIKLFDHECKRLLNLTAKVVHRLQQPLSMVPQSDHDRQWTQPKVEQSAIGIADHLSFYAMQLASQAQLGGSEDVQVRWHGIRRRVKLKLADSVTASAREEEAVIAELKQRIAARAATGTTA